MLNNFESAIIATLQLIAVDPEARGWSSDSGSALYAEANFGGGPRRIRFDDGSKTYLGGMNEVVRESAMRSLFIGAAEWPDGAAEVICVQDALTLRPFGRLMDLQAFVGGHSVGNGAHLSR